MFLNGALDVVPSEYCWHPSVLSLYRGCGHRKIRILFSRNGIGTGPGWAVTELTEENRGRAHPVLYLFSAPLTLLERSVGRNNRKKDNNKNGSFVVTCCPLFCSFHVIKLNRSSLLHLQPWCCPCFVQERTFYCMEREGLWSYNTLDIKNVEVTFLQLPWG